ncbi:succinate dehydrogenase cytochrome b560 subunit [Durotheca rogersii]|uniref:succinate dehydrogenase cytochrome b560 subunit n=1 Tax=Durotheca rogersii TaxID=419775 RepID=UPI002220C375|nr:succinate dehydrogenase cytochrome b560 subunit [Durotheca rogersii]KAI5867336.1 succinate dehydrogenase cytochrome b560 subunit [Durotheca rogersii]
MSTQRVGLRALRQVAARQPNALLLPQNVPRLALAASVMTSQIRVASTQKLTPTDAQSLLAAQRLRRPVSPHLGVYDYAQTWFGASIWTRVTGQVMSAGLYAFSLAYLAAPLTGWHLESATLAAAAAALPPALFGTLKLLAAWPFFFHLANGIRHLVWDFAIGFQRPTINKTSNLVLGVSLVASLAAVIFI